MNKKALTYQQAIDRLAQNYIDVNFGKSGYEDKGTYLAALFADLERNPRHPQTGEYQMDLIDTYYWGGIDEDMPGHIQNAMSAVLADNGENRDEIEIADDLAARIIALIVASQNK